MIFSKDLDSGRIILSTKAIEPTPGDMLRDRQLVFSNAEVVASKIHESFVGLEVFTRLTMYNDYYLRSSCLDEYTCL